MTDVDGQDYCSPWLHRSPLRFTWKDDVSAWLCTKVLAEYAKIPKYTRHIRLVAEASQVPESYALKIVRPGVVTVDGEWRVGILPPFAAWLKNAPKDKDGYTHVWLECS